MSVKKNSYIAIRDRILLETEVKTSRLYNSQFDNESQEATYTLPAAFIEFSELVYRSNAEGVQEVDARIRIYVGASSLKTEDLEVLDLLETVHASLQGFLAVPDSTPLDRVFEGQDVNHDAVTVWVMDYETRLTDTSGSRNNKLISIVLDEIEVDGEAEKPRLKQLL
tara:strand:- start:827 stop:1327 length:501 start_codon:yes stop_codon:yes gene_type:complete